MSANEVKPAALAHTSHEHRDRRRSRVPRLLRSYKGTAALLLALVIIGSAIFAPMLTPYHPNEQDLQRRIEPPSRDHLLGTDQFGRDVFTRILYGGRSSLVTGLGAVLFGTTLGIIVGVTAGYFGGPIGMALMAIVDVLLGFRTFLLAIMVVAILGASMVNLIIAIGLAMFPEISRIIRSEVLSVRNRDFVDAARALGANNSRIIGVHVLPQVLAPVVVVATFNIANAIVVEASLSFLGLGVSPPTPAWGLMISDGRRFILQDPWLPAIPGFAIMFTVLAFNLLGDTVRDLRDPRLRQR